MSWLRMVLEEGSTFAGRYVLVKLLGRGGFSEVWLAKDERSGLDIALKVYAPYGGLDDKGAELFCKEFALVFNINQTNLLKPTYYDVYDRSPYLILPYCGKGSAYDLVGKANGDTLLDIIHDVASGLSYLHAQDPPIIHQDIKPDNILINDNGDYVITDFGISTKARSTLRKSVVSKEGSGGTYAYMGPERFSRQPAPIKASDIWSLGAMAYELSEGVPPFDNMGGVMQKNGAEIPDIQSDIPQDIKDVIYACLSKETWDRPSAEELVDWTGRLKRGEKLELMHSEKQPASAPVPEVKQQLRSHAAPAPAPAPVPKAPEKKEVPMNDGDGQDSIVNRLKAFFRKDKKRILYPVAALMLLCIVIALASSHGRNRKETEAERARQEQFIKERTDSLKNAISDSSDPQYVEYDPIVTDKAIRSAGYYIMTAKRMLRNEASVQDGIELLERVLDKGYVSSAEAAAVLSNIYARKIATASTDEIYNELSSSYNPGSVSENPQLSHSYGEKAVELDPECYQASLELLLDYLAGNEGSRNRGASARDMRKAFTYLEKGSKAAVVQRDSVYVDLFGSIAKEYRSAFLRDLAEIDVSMKGPIESFYETVH